jgi:sugar fermentation stimulation protein A
VADTGRLEEIRYGASRFDYRVDDAWVELKGCSLVIGGTCLFPNAPTARGTRHLRELIRARAEGFSACLLLMAVRPCRCFMPHPERDPAFRRIFYEALENGVEYRRFTVGIDETLRVLYRGGLKLCGEQGERDSRPLKGKIT